MFARFAARLKTYRSNQRTLSLLSQMEDRQLQDIGLARGDIASAVRYGRLQY